MSFNSIMTVFKRRAELCSIFEEEGRGKIYLISRKDKKEEEKIPGCHLKVKQKDQTDNFSTAAPGKKRERKKIPPEASTYNVCLIKWGNFSSC